MLEELADKVRSGTATEQERAEYRSAAEGLAASRRAARLMQQQERLAATDGDAVARPETVAATAAVQEVG